MAMSRVVQVTVEAAALEALKRGGHILQVARELDDASTEVWFAGESFPSRTQIGVLDGLPMRRRIGTGRIDAVPTAPGRATTPDGQGVLGVAGAGTPGVPGLRNDHGSARVELLLGRRRTHRRAGRGPPAATSARGRCCAARSSSHRGTR